MHHVFDATYDPAGAATAERNFHLRSLRELRGLLTLGPPMGLSVFVAAGLALGAPIWWVAFFAGGQTANIAWGRIKHVWEAGDHVLLVLGKFTSISIPKRSLPPGANEFIRASVQNAG